jgi:SAM-dependent methyltransferase
MSEADGWSHIAAVFSEEMRTRYYGLGPDAAVPPATAATLRTNTELVPRRTQQILDWLHGLLGHGLDGLRVLEAGCGFGAFASYIAWREHPAEVIASDVDGRVLEVARAAAARLDLGSPVLPVEADMRDLRAFADASFDVIVLNNSFIYLATAEDQAQALRELRRVLRPGGAIVAYHANKLRIREPFTNAPLVHLLPQRIADATPWRHNHGRVLYVSPRTMRRLMAEAGFVGPRILTRRKARGPIARQLTTFYCVGARG